MFLVFHTQPSLTFRKERNEASAQSKTAKNPFHTTTLDETLFGRYEFMRCTCFYYSSAVFTLSRSRLDSFLARSIMEINV